MFLTVNTVHLWYEKSQNQNAISNIYCNSIGIHAKISQLPFKINNSRVQYKKVDICMYICTKISDFHRINLVP